MYDKEGDVFYQQRKDMTFENFIDKVEMSDLSRRTKEKIGIIGISPTLPKAIESKFVTIKSSVDQINHNP
jgi:hypothetical protein